MFLNATSYQYDEKSNNAQCGSSDTFELSAQETYIVKIRLATERIRGCKDREVNHQVYSDLFALSKEIAKDYSLALPLNFTRRNCEDLFFIANTGIRQCFEDYKLDHAICYGIATSDSLAILQLARIGKLGKIPDYYNALNILFLKALGKYAIRRCDDEVDLAKRNLCFSNVAKAPYNNVEAIKKGIASCRLRLENVISGFRIVSDFNI